MICPELEEDGEKLTKHPAEEPNPNNVQDEGRKEPPDWLVKKTLPVGVASECELSATFTMQNADEPSCSVEGLQFRLTTMLRRVVELVDVAVLDVVEVVSVLDNEDVEDVLEVVSVEVDVEVLSVEVEVEGTIDVVDCEIVWDKLVVVYENVVTREIVEEESVVLDGGALVSELVVA